MADLDINYRMIVGLRFKATDAPRLTEMSRQAIAFDEEERAAFKQAAKAAREGTQLVVQTMDKEQLQNICTTFALAGVWVTAIDDMRVERPWNDLATRFGVR